MKKLLTLLTLVLLLASCGSSYSGNRKPKSQIVEASKTNNDYRDVPFRAHYTWLSSVTYDRIVSDNVEIIYADSAFRAGDTILVGNKDYILTERVK